MSVFDLRVNKTTSKIYLFQFGLSSVLRAEDLGANLTFGVLEGTHGAGLENFLLRSKSVSFNGPLTGPFVSLIHCGAWAVSAPASWHFIGQ